MTQANDREFRMYMRRVDACLEARIGLSSGDLPDACYRDMFEGGMEPMEAAKEAIAAADDCGDLDLIDLEGELS
jgi:hypothetical protein